MTGVVEEIELRAMRLRDLFGNVHVVPNWVIDKVKNMTKDYFYYEFSIGIPYREKADEVMGVLQEIAADLRRDPECADDILAPLEMFGADQFADSAVVIKCPVKTRPIKPWRVGREMNRRIKKTFDAKGIEIPSPYQTIYWGEPKHGMPPPLLYYIWRNWERVPGLQADGLRSCVGGGIAHESRDR